jgi:hypothetical protein
MFSIAARFTSPRQSLPRYDRPPRRFRLNGKTGVDISVATNPGPPVLFSPCECEDATIKVSEVVNVGVLVTTSGAFGAGTGVQN